MDMSVLSQSFVIREPFVADRTANLMFSGKAVRSQSLTGAENPTTNLTGISPAVRVIILFISCCCHFSLRYRDAGCWVLCHSEGQGQTDSEEE